MEGKIRPGIDRDERDDAAQAPKVGSMMAQHAALRGAAETAGATGGAHLLSTTGPLAEMHAAQRRGVLDETRRTLIARKGAGVVFEAKTVVQLQEAAERLGFSLEARLAGKANNPRVDIFVRIDATELELQLKTGSDRYIRAALSAKEDGVILLVPRDAATGEAVGRLELDGTVLETPTRAEILAQSEATLGRLQHGEAVVSIGDMATRALRDSWTAGLVAVVLDLADQLLRQPTAEVDWARAARSFLKASVTGTAASFVAQASAVSAVGFAGHAIDATGVLRGARVAGVVVPHLVDIACEWASVRRGELTAEGFGRGLAGHAGAAGAEYLLFPVIARFAARLGPIGGALLVIGAGLLASKLGRTIGEVLFDVFHELPADTLMSAFLASAEAVEKVAAAQARTKEESERRAALAERSLCEEAGCNGPHHARGMCGKHYMRWWRAHRRMGYPSAETSLTRAATNS